MPWTSSQILAAARNRYGHGPQHNIDLDNTMTMWGRAGHPYQQWAWPLNTNMDTGCGLEPRHPCGLCWHHEPLASTLATVMGHSPWQQPRISSHHGPRWQHSTLRSAWPSWQSGPQTPTCPRWWCRSLASVWPSMSNFFILCVFYILYLDSIYLPVLLYPHSALASSTLNKIKFKGAGERILSWKL